VTGSIKALLSNLGSFKNEANKQTKAKQNQTEDVSVVWF